MQKYRLGEGTVKFLKELLLVTDVYDNLSGSHLQSQVKKRCF